jgi:hypothetical protein
MLHVGVEEVKFTLVHAVRAKVGSRGVAYSSASALDGNE